MCAEQRNYNILQWGSSFQSDNVDNIYIYINIHMLLTTDRFFEVTIESWPESDLKPRPLNCVQTIRP